MSAFLDVSTSRKFIALYFRMSVTSLKQNDREARTLINVTGVENECLHDDMSEQLINFSHDAAYLTP